MHLHERSLGVLGCRYVDEVIIGAPCEVTMDMVSKCISIFLLYIVSCIACTTRNNCFSHFIGGLVLSSFRATISSFVKCS